MINALLYLITFFQACRILLTFGVDASIVSLQVSEVDLLFGLYFGRALALFHSRAVCQHWEHLKVMNLNWDFVSLRVSQQPSFPLSLLERSWQRNPQLEALILVSFSHFYPFWENVFIKLFIFLEYQLLEASKAGDLELVKKIVNLHPHIVNCRDLDGERPWPQISY